MNELNDLLKQLQDTLESTILVTHAGPHIYWGWAELRVYFGCEQTKLKQYTDCADFPEPAVYESASRKRWLSTDVVKWYKGYLTKQGRPRAA